MASPLPARNVVSTQSANRPYDEALLEQKNKNRKVSVIYGKSSVPTLNVQPANDNPRPRDTAIKAAANDNQKTATAYKMKNSFPQGNYGQSTVSDDFNETYNEAGLQPSVGRVSQYRNTQIDRSPATQPYSAAPAIDRSRATKTVSQKKELLGETVSLASPTRVRTGLKNPKKVLLESVTGGDTLAGDLINRALVTRTSLILASAGGFFWSTFQVPLAIVSLSALGLASALEGAKQFFESNTIGSFISWVAGKVFDSFNSVLEAVWGFDLNAFSPMTLFMLTDGVVMLIGWFTLLIIGFVYLIQGVPCVFGEKGSGLKIATLLMAMIGYALPVFNLFPWFGFWVFAVWLYPE